MQAFWTNWGLIFGRMAVVRPVCFATCRQTKTRQKTTKKLSEKSWSFLVGPSNTSLSEQEKMALRAYALYAPPRGTYNNRQQRNT